MAILMAPDTAGRMCQFEATGASEMNELGISQIGVANIRSESVAVTSAQILAMFTTPIQIVKPTPGKTVMVLAASLLYLRGSADYTGADDLALWYDTPALAHDGGSLIVDFGNWASLVTNNTLIQKTPGFTLAASGFTGVGDGIQLSTATANPAAGNGSVVVKVLYARI